MTVETGPDARVRAGVGNAARAFLLSGGEDREQAPMEIVVDAAGAR